MTFQGSRRKTKDDIQLELYEKYITVSIVNVVCTKNSIVLHSKALSHG